MSRQRVNYENARARARSVLDRSRAGETYRDIAADLGVGRGRVAQLTQRARNDIRRRHETVIQGQLGLSSHELFVLVRWLEMNGDIFDL